MPILIKATLPEAGLKEPLMYTINILESAKQPTPIYCSTPLTLALSPQWVERVVEKGLRLPNASLSLQWVERVSEHPLSLWERVRVRVLSPSPSGRGLG